MNTRHKDLRIMRGCLILLAAVAATVGSATPASAYLLNKTSSCSPGQKWDSSRPVKVRLLGDSVADYLNNRVRYWIDARSIWPGSTPTSGR